MTAYPSKQELIDFLREPGRKKHRGGFQSPDDPEARCCLGHYAHMCGILGEPGQGWFCEVDAGPGWAVLPSDHWLLATSTPALVDAAGDITMVRPHLQDLLLVVNDETDGFDAVIAVLEAE